MSALPPTHVVIPVHHAWAQAKGCLDAVRKSTCYDALHVVVVDHGAVEDAGAEALSGYPEITCLTASPELWWTGATNHGIRWAMEREAQRVVLLNSDCHPDGDALERLLAHARQQPGAVIAAQQRDFATRRPLHGRLTTCFLLGFPTLDLPRPPARRATPGALVPTRLIVGGRGALIPCDVLRRVGLFDEAALPHYGADHDFYLRCREQGIPLLLALDARVFVDDRTTSQAHDVGPLRCGEFIETLRSPRSHRNLKDLRTLFRRHYPIRGLHDVGLALNLVRYALVYAWRRARFLLQRNDTPSAAAPPG